MKKFVIICLLLIFCQSKSISQIGSKGIQVSENQQSFSDNIKMVVIGVSKYQNIQSLNYAHTDALSFYNFMISKDGGNIDSLNTRIILNEQATAINIYSALDWLLTETKEGETVIFYFSGHGDLENKTLSQQGFLLANDSPKAAYMAGGTIGVFYLQQYLNTLVQKNKARVILISDACRSGKLAGGIEGASSTTAALQIQQENTIKILSSQPGELSYEGKQWNGGGGVFTFYLVKGLMGFADRNNDYKITLNELIIYLNDNVPKETNFAQNPSINGNPTTVIARVDSVHFASIKNNEVKLNTDNKQVAQRGSNDDFDKILDTASYNNYLLFRKCIEQHFLLKNDLNQANAWDIYQEMKKNTKAEVVINTMKSTLLSALQEKCQLTYNFVINGIEPPANLPRLVVANELKHALMLIDTNYILYKHIAAAYALSLIPVEEEVYSIIWESQSNKAIALEPDNPIPYLFLGNYYFGLKKYEISIENYKKAVVLAPSWTWPMGGIAKGYMKLKQFDNALSWYEKRLSIDTSNVYYYIQPVNCCIELDKLDKAEYFLQQAEIVCLQKKDAYNLVGIGYAYLNIPKIKNSEKVKYYFEKAISMGHDKPETFLILGNIYKQEKNKEKSIIYYSKAIQVYLVMVQNDPTNNGIYYDLACLYCLIENKDEALKYLELSLKNGWEDYKYLKKDTDLDYIRNTPQFNDLIKKYSKR